MSLTVASDKFVQQYIFALVRYQILVCKYKTKLSERWRKCFTKCWLKIKFDDESISTSTTPAFTEPSRNGEWVNSELPNGKQFVFKFCCQLWKVYMRLILNQKTEGTTEANTNILLTAIFNLSKNQDRLDFFSAKLPLSNHHYQNQARE